MSGFFKVFGLSAVSAIAVVAVCNADTAVAPGRAAYQNVRPMAGANAAPRMPSMPTITIPGTVTDVTIKNPQTPQPEPEPEPEPEPTPDCPDGGVKNSDYTVENCMDDLKACITGGALSGGMTELYDKNIRDDIFANMGLCRVQVEKCIADVRVNCEYVYETSADVWYDFNLRRVQPEYFDFVLRKTGLTPYQAENTCRLLDKNTYGTEFAAVDGAVTDEYDNKIGAYNEQQNNSLQKDNPVGALVNENGAVDAERGHYARWDAKTATCYIRVAAYNKDKHISNTWLFGAAGDDQPAEVWQPAGSSFKCNKDLFGFSLMNDTRTVATVAVPGGAIVGAGVGAGIGAGTGAETDCSDAKTRDRWYKRIQKNGVETEVQQLLGVESLTTLNEQQCKDLKEFRKLFVPCQCHATVVDKELTITISGGDDAVQELWKNISEVLKTDADKCEAVCAVLQNAPAKNG
ncbi:MAG: hypothetical protein IKK76_04675, partial [Alphaproteobacteria bacterium]|nr:hypothetical protein [Alphaproteobacteria bacterium]